MPSADILSRPIEAGRSVSRAALGRLDRLRQMGLAEIAGRTRQEAWRWWDRVASAARRPSVRSVARPRLRLAAFRADVPGRFFAGATDPRISALVAECCPEWPAEILAAAEQAVTGRFDLLGYRDLSFGDPVDWLLDPVAQRRSPLAHSTLLDPLDAASVGDSKVVWELSRQQWLVTLGQAYGITGDERYAQAFAGHARGWLEANPVGRGLNWASSLEAALRIIAWSWALVLFRRSPSLDAALFGQMCASVRDHATHVERYLSHYFSPNTHLTGEALGLFYAGTVFPELGAARRWRARGAELLVRELDRQVLPDGVYFEQSTCYQRYTAEIALHFLILSARTGLSLPSSVTGRVEALLDFLLAVRSPGGDAPQVGDSDGGRLLPLARRTPADLRGVFGTAAAALRRPDYAWAAGGVVPELLWLLGEQGLAEFQSLEPSPPAGTPSRLFPDGGYAVMRSAWSADAHHLVFDTGPLGCPVTAGHGHADLLSIQCSAFGQPFLVDPGTGTYADEPWRSHFRGTSAHSTVVVDGAGQAVPAGPFAWRQRPSARLRRWVSTQDFDFADAEHDAYQHLADPVRHRRRVLFVKPRYWVLVDDLEGAGRHEVELRFQFGLVEADLERDGWARAVAGGHAMLVGAFATAPLQVCLRRGSVDPLDGWLSSDYGQRQPAPALLYSATAVLPLRLVTVLLPCADPTAPIPEVRLLAGPGRTLAGLAFPGAGEAVSIADDENGLVWSSVAPPS